MHTFNGKAAALHAGVLLIGMTLAGCDAKGPAISDGEAVPGAANVVNLAQGWSQDVQDQAWFASFGSRLVPYRWLLHLEAADGSGRLADPDYLAGFGFLPQTPTTHNPDGLPVGVTRARDGEGNEWAGLGCAACHTGEVRHGAQRIRIDGGQAWLDFTAFERALIESLSATAEDDATFARFADALDTAEDQRIGLRDALTERAEALDARHRMDATDVAYGPGRLDAFGQIFNAVAVDFLGIPENRRAPDAPVSFPALWTAPHLDLVQWNGSAPNAGPGPLIQNITTALAVYGHAELAGHDGMAGYPTNIDFESLGKIQDWTYQLTAPQWPQDILGKLDIAMQARGEQVYATECGSCHARIDPRDPKRKPLAVLTPLSDVGTDPRMVRNFLDSRSRSGALQGRKQAVLAGAPLGAEAPTIDLVIHVAIGSALRHPLASVRDAVVGYHDVHKAAINQHPDYYKARPLDGIWASAPYLHNGSVPTLAALLRQPEQRPARFHVGTGQFDADSVGLADISEGSLFDTALVGNGNGGHLYGTALPEKDKRDLLEFLKSL